MPFANSTEMQFHTYFANGDDPYLLVGAPASKGRMLVGAIPVESLNLAESSDLVEGEMQGAMFVMDADGRTVHHHNTTNVDLEPASLHSLLMLPTAAGTTHRRVEDQEMIFAYARIDPPGWLLISAEDVGGIGRMGMSVVEVLPLVLLFVAVAALLAVSLGVANVVRPLQELDRRAARVAWGEFDAVEEPVGGVQEIDDLRVTIAHMAERIRAYQAGMRDYLSAVTRCTRGGTCAAGP